MNLFKNLKSYDHINNIGIFLITCGSFSFYCGIITNILLIDANKIISKYNLPKNLEFTEPFIIAYDGLFRVLYKSTLYGLIGLTWPVTLPLIKYLYKDDSN